MVMKLSKIVVALALVAAGGWAMTRGVAQAADRRVDVARVASVDVFPRMALKGNGGRVIVRVPADADNRRLRVEIGSGSLVAVGEVALDGLASQDAYLFTLPALPAGQYYITAIVYGTNGPLARASSQMGRR